MANVWGMALPNGPMDLGRIVACGFGHYLALEDQASELKRCPGRPYLRLWTRGVLQQSAASIAARVLGAGFLDVIPWNEANLPQEGGFSEAALYNATAREARYLAIAGLFLDVKRRVGSARRLHFPAWALGHYHRELVDLWGDAAEEADVIDVHAYGTVDQILAEVDWYRSTFPKKTLLLSEYNWRLHGPEVVDLNAWGGEVKRLHAALLDRPDVLAAVAFIWRWHNPDSILKQSLDWEGTVLEIMARSALKPDRKEDQVKYGTEFQGVLPAFRLGNAVFEDARSLVHNGFDPASFHGKDVIIVHNDAVDGGSTVEAIDRYHAKYGGFGYDMFIPDGPSPRILVCSDLAGSRAGAAQISGLNRRAWHICLGGRFSEERQPGQVQRQAARRAIAELQQQAGWWVPVVPHRAFNSGSAYDTVCPGPGYQRWWGDLLRRVGE